MKYGTIRLDTNIKFKQQAENWYQEMTGEELNTDQYCTFCENENSGWAISWLIEFPMVKEIDKLLNFLTEDSKYWPKTSNAVNCPRYEKGRMIVQRNGFVEELLKTGFRIGKNHDAEEVEIYTENKEDFENAVNTKVK